jgi:hypothetical protein
MRNLSGDQGYRIMKTIDNSVSGARPETYMSGAPRTGWHRGRPVCGAPVGNCAASGPHTQVYPYAVVLPIQISAPPGI